MKINTNKISEFIIIASAFAVIIMLTGAIIYTSVHPSMKASVSSIKKLDTCERGAISSLIKTYTREPATNSEVEAAKQICYNISVDRALLIKAQANKNLYLIKEYTKALNNSNPTDIAYHMYNAEYSGIIYHVNSSYRNEFGPNGPHQHWTLYHIYSPEAIIIRDKDYRKYLIRQKKTDAELKAEE